MKKLTLLLLICMGYITAKAQNNAPVATNDLYTTESCAPVELDVLQNDYDPDGDDLFIFSVNASKGSAGVLNQYIPNEGYIRYSIGVELVQGITLHDTILYILTDDTYAPGSTPELADTGYVFLTIEDGHCYYEIDANNFKTGVKTGILSFFWDFQASQISEVPKGSGKTTLFSASPWIGGYDVNGELHIAAQRYAGNGNDYQFGPICNNSYYDDEYKAKWNKLWGVTKEQIDYHKIHFNDPAYEIPWVIENWPAHGDVNLGQAENLALFTDADNNGYYSPSGGDYPIIYGDEAVYFIVNDDLEHTETGGEKLGIEMHIMFYEFNTPENGAFNNTLFMHYRIINRSTNSYDDTYFGMFSDYDIGYPIDDYIGSDVERGAYYAYNSLPIDGNGASNHYGEYPPAQALMFLKGPSMDEDGIDNPAFDPNTGNNCGFAVNGYGFGDGIADNECIGMTNFINNKFVGPYAPTAEGFYNMLNSKLLDGSDLTFGATYNGNGGIVPHPVTQDLACKYWCPANSDPCNWGTSGVNPYDPDWTVPNPNPYFGDTWSELGMGTGGGDRYGVGSAGPFTLLPGSEHNIHLAYVYARSYTPEDSLSIFALQNRLDSLKTAFANNVAPNGGQIYDITEHKATSPDKINISLHPNPAGNSITISNKDSETMKYKILDIMGRVTISGTLTSGDNNIDISNLKKGIYILHTNNGQNTQPIKFIKQ